MSELQLAALTLFGCCVAAAFSAHLLTECREDKARALALLNAFAALLVINCLRLSLPTGPDIHFLLTGALTLTLGFRAALCCSTATLLVTTAAGITSPAQLGINGICFVLLPVGLTYLLYALALHRLPRHFFSYIFLCAFLPAALVLALSMLLAGQFYIAQGLYSAETIVHNYYQIIPLLLFPEALLNGIIMTILVLYRPQWVYTFHDRFYFDDRE